MGGAVTDIAEVSEYQMDVRSPAAASIQQQHRQPDPQTCALLVHEVLEPLAKAGSTEQLLCHHAIQRLLPDLRAAKQPVDAGLSRIEDSE